MANNFNQPGEWDAVLGGGTPPPVSGVVLGGIEGVKSRLTSQNVEARVAAVAEAIAYGEEGLYLAIQALQDEAERVRNVAYSLLQHREEPSIKQALRQYKPWRFFEYLYSTTGHSSTVTCSAIAPNGRILISGSNNEIKEWDLETGREVRYFSWDTRYGKSIYINPDGQTALSVHGYYRININWWNLNTGHLLRTLNETLSSPIISVAIAPDWQTVFSLRYRALQVWDLKSGTLIRSLKIHFGKLSCAAFSPDGNILVGGYDNSLRVWDLTTGREIYTLKGHLGKIACLAISPDGQTLLSSGDRTIKVWNLPAGKLIRTIWAHERPILSFAISPNWQTLVSTSEDKTVKVWNLEKGQEICTGQWNSEPTVSLAISQNPQVFVATSRHTAEVRDLQTGQAIRSFSLVGHLGYIHCAIVTPCGQTIVSGGDTIKLWELTTGQLVRTLGEYSSSVYSLAISPDGQTLVSSSHNSSIKLWDLRKGQEIRTLTGHSKWVNSVAMNSQGRTFASGSQDGTVKIWDLETGEAIRTLQAHSEGVRAVAITPDGRNLASCANGYRATEGAVKVWDLETGQQIHAFDGYPVTGIAIAPDGETAVSQNWSDVNTLKVWNLKTGEELRTFRETAHSLAISPDGGALFAGSDRHVINVWDLKTGELVRTLKGHSGNVNFLTISSDGQTLVSCGRERSIKVWGVR